MYLVAAAVVGAVAIFGPIIARTLVSPVTVLLLSPILVLLAVLGALTFNVAAGVIVDSFRPVKKHSLRNAVRPLAFTTPAAWQAAVTRSQWTDTSSGTLSPLFPDIPAVSAAIDEIIGYIIRDFVIEWYQEISRSQAFPDSVKTTLYASLTTLVERAAAIDLPTLIVKRILPKLTAHVEQFRQSEVALRGAELERHLTQSEELDLLLASRYASGGKLHSAIGNLSSMFTRQSEERHLKHLVELAIPHMLPKNEANSSAVKLVVREIVACTVLYPIVELFTDPDFWNRTMDQAASAAIAQQRLISKVRSVLQSQSGSSARNKSEALSIGIGALEQAEAITSRTDVRRFESFLRSIGRCNSLLDARRLKNDVVSEIRRTRSLLASHENEEWINGERTEDLVAYLDRLYTAKRTVENRIGLLGGSDRSSSHGQSEHNVVSGVTLRDILANPSSLSYFMEFMDRKNRSILVQFWLTVESFKNPLESVDSDSEDEPDSLADPQAFKTLLEDVSMIEELYFPPDVTTASLPMVSAKHVEVIHTFTADPTQGKERLVRRSVLLAQRQVERDMQHDFEEFQRSELWFKVIGDMDIGSTRSPIRSGGAITSPSHRPNSYALSDDRSPRVSTESRPARPLPTILRSSPDVLSRTESDSSQLLADKDARPGLNDLMDPSENARAPLFDDVDSLVDDAQRSRMDAIQAALSDILAEETQKQEDDSLSGAPSIREGSSNGGERVAVASQTYVNLSVSNGSEQHDTLAPLEDTYPSGFPVDPGNFQLSSEISRMAERIVRMESQDLMLDALIRKAELTGDAQEVRLLQTSKSALEREIRELTFQKSQYEQQELVNRLIPGRTRLFIPTSNTADEDSKSVVRYLIEVQQLGPDGSQTSGWVVARRYNEFFNMHQNLRDKYGGVRNLEFPGKKLVTSISTSFVDMRRNALERYIQGLIATPAVCSSPELRAFLSRDSPFNVPPSQSTGKLRSLGFSGQSIVQSVYRSVTGSFDDIFSGPSMLDITIQRLTRQAAETVGIIGTGSHDEDFVTQAYRESGKPATPETLMQFPSDLKPLEGESSASSFIAPICDLILAVFEMDRRNNWLRRHAIVIILQQVLGGTIERQLKNSIKEQLDENRVLTGISALKEGLWPNGHLRLPSAPRTAQEKLWTRDAAHRKLSSLIPDVAANVIGRSNARRGARRIFAVLQNRRLNQHIVYTVIDEIFLALFPSLSLPRNPE